MKVEHITLGGNSIIRDTSLISTVIKTKLSAITGESQVIWIPDIPFKIVITNTKEGCIFNLQKDEIPITINICCFEDKYKNQLIDLVSKINYFKFDIIDPITPSWIYTVIFPVDIHPSQLTLAGEIELYIYEILFNKNNKIK